MERGKESGRGNDVLWKERKKVDGGNEENDVLWRERDRKWKGNDVLRKERKKV